MNSLLMDKGLILMTVGTHRSTPKYNGLGQIDWPLVTSSDIQWPVALLEMIIIVK